MEIPEAIREKAPQMELTELDRYIDKVWKLLEAMKPGDIFVIEKLCKPDTRELFVECIKYYMRSHPWQDGLSFTRGFINLQKYDISFSKGRNSKAHGTSLIETESVKM